VPWGYITPSARTTRLVSGPHLAIVRRALQLLGFDLDPDRLGARILWAPECANFA
jgi:hypothetical protein